MTDSDGKDTHHVQTLHASSGERCTSSEHHPAEGTAEPGTNDRGRYIANQPLNKDGRVTTNKLRQAQGRQQEVCPGSVTLPKCPTTLPPQEPGADTAGDVIAAHGNSGDGPTEETLSQVQGESGKHFKNSSVPGVGVDPSRPGKKKHRRRPSKKKRRWKPYYKLSWEEKKEFDERETARASRVRAEMFAKGLPVAPYNTTQFLMEEHDREEPDLNTENGSRRLVGLCRPEDTGSEEDMPDYEDDDDDGSGGGSDGIGRPGNAGGEFLQRDFSETYEKYHVESLQNMTKQELVQEYLELEKCMSRLEEENVRLRLAADGSNIKTESPVSMPEPERLKELENELARLRAQNSELRLQKQLSQERAQIVASAE
ncbi:protein HEXIM-like [Chanos chanos]|uniref:Protein HEXIM-like n=1 Tax=Chanos chanos TaxID=29144 RepID=A0A6J2WZK0_CHACN|nr:protein HEXIM-like [Chanos chanos]